MSPICTKYHNEHLVPITDSKEIYWLGCEEVVLSHPNQPLLWRQGSSWDGVVKPRPCTVDESLEPSAAANRRSVIVRGALCWPSASWRKCSSIRAERTERRMRCMLQVRIIISLNLVKMFDSFGWGVLYTRAYVCNVLYKSADELRANRWVEYSLSLHISVNILQ